jgi:hypothetical protein
MRLVPKLRLQTFLRVTQVVARMHNRLFNRLLRRLFHTWFLAMWEVPNADPLITNSFMVLLDRMYDRQDPERGVLQQMVVFRVRGSAPQVFICGAFHRDYWPAAQQTLMQVVGVERVFTVDPTILLGQALVGSIDMQVCYNR